MFPDKSKHAYTVIVGQDKTVSEFSANGQTDIYTLYYITRTFLDLSECK